MAIQAPDFDRLRDQLRIRQAALARLDEPVERSLEALRETVRAAFDSEGATAGAAWPPLAERTRRDKARRGYPPQPLVRTGLLRDAWDVRMQGPGRGVLASLAPYARAHEEGMGRLPQRRFLPTESETLAAAREALARHIAAALDLPA